MKKKNYKITLLITLLLITLLLSIYSFSFFHFLIRKIGLGVVPSYIIGHFIVLFLSILCIISLVRFNIKKWVKLIFSALLPLLFMSVSFLQNPFFPEDFENRAATLELNQEQLTKLNNISSAKTTCFFLATCPFCEIASDYLNDLYISGQIKDIEIIYYAYQKTADSIVQSRGIQIPYKTIEDNSFFEFSGNSFPAVLLRENDSLKKWVGNDVNFACFDYLVSNQ